MIGLFVYLMINMYVEYESVRFSFILINFGLEYLACKYEL